MRAIWLGSIIAGVGAVIGITAPLGSLRSGGDAKNPAEIMTVPLRQDAPMVIPVGTEDVTTLYFPQDVTAIIGYGLTRDGTEGHYQVEHPEGSRLVAVRCLLPGRNASMSVMSGEKLYIFKLESSTQPVLAVHLEDAKGATAPGRKLSPEEVRNRRLEYSAPRLLNRLELARGEEVFRPALPEVYSAVHSRYPKEGLKYDYDLFVTVIESVHRFEDDDALAISAVITNRQPDTRLRFDPVRLRLKAGRREYLPTVVDASGVVEPGQTAHVYFVISGNPEGGRAHLSVWNDFRLALPLSTTFEAVESDFPAFEDVLPFEEVLP